ncbi:MAG: VOC family protein [Saprospiraceae bacterium]|nr:VOC family protein [Lewinella sp.]
MPITNTRYVLAVSDLARSVDYYTQQLGFSIRFAFPGWTYVQRDQCIIMLGECPNEIPPTALGDHAYFAYIEVEDIDALHEEYSQKEVRFRKSLRTEDWGMKEFAVQTIDGHRIMFGEEA